MSWNTSINGYTVPLPLHFFPQRSLDCRHWSGVRMMYTGLFPCTAHGQRDTSIKYTSCTQSSHLKGQNPLYRFPRSMSTTSPQHKRQVRNNLTARGSYGETCVMDFVHKTAYTGIVHNTQRLVIVSARDSRTGRRLNRLDHIWRGNDFSVGEAKVGEPKSW